MAINFSGTTMSLSDDGALRNQGVKVDTNDYVLTATADDQVNFTLPFSYHQGDPITVVIDNITYSIGKYFTVSGDQLTLGDSIPALDLGDEILVIG